MLKRGAERRKRDFRCLSAARKGEKEIFGVKAWRRKAKIGKEHASERFRNTKWRFFMLLHTAERQKRSFSRFCTLQKGKKEVFHASAHCRKTKKKFFMLLHIAERPKRSFSCFWTFQKGQNEDFHASEHFRKTKMKFFTLLNVSERLKKEELPLAHNFLLRYSVKRREVLGKFRHLVFWA